MIQTIPAVEVQRRVECFGGLGDGVAQCDQVLAYARIQRVRVGPIDLHQVVGRVAEVHLDRPVRQLVHPGEECARVLQPLLARAPVDGLEVVDVQGDMMKPRRRHV